MAQQVDEVAHDVFLGRGTDVNWVLLREGSDVTLIDSGYPGDTDRVEASIRAIGRRPADVRAVLITHAHVAAGAKGAVFKLLDGTQVQVGAPAVAVGHDQRLDRSAKGDQRRAAGCRNDGRRQLCGQ